MMRERSAAWLVNSGLGLLATKSFVRSTAVNGVSPLNSMGTGSPLVQFRTISFIPNLEFLQSG